MKGFWAWSQFSRLPTVNLGIFYIALSFFSHFRKVTQSPVWKSPCTPKLIILSMTIIYPRNKTTLDFSFYNKYFFFWKLTTIVITFSKTSKISEINAIVEENFLQNTKMPLRGELRQGFSEKQERKVCCPLLQCHKLRRSILPFQFALVWRSSRSTR